jgi:Rrf2 family cysteine metabolism transcriptional repressor
VRFELPANCFGRKQKPVAARASARLTSRRLKLSVKSDYATRAVLSLARHHSHGGVVRVELLAREHGIPPAYLVQILILLKAKGLVRSQRGKVGGYSLALTPDKITFGDVVRAVEGAILEGPALDGGNCPPEIRAAWTRLQSAADSAADSMTFQQLMDQSPDKEKMYYI